MGFQGYLLCGYCIADRGCDGISVFFYIYDSAYCYRVLEMRLAREYRETVNCGQEYSPKYEHWLKRAFLSDSYFQVDDSFSSND